MKELIETKKTKPRQEYTMFDDGVKAWLYGKPYNHNPSANPDAARVISELARKVGVTVFGPVPSDANRRVVMPDDLNEEVANGFYRGQRADGMYLMKPGQAFALASADCPAVIARDPSSEIVGCFHASRDSLVNRPALNILKDDYNGQFAAKSIDHLEDNKLTELAERDRELFDDPGRIYDSVVQHGVERMIREFDTNAPTLEVFIFLGIAGRHYTHPTTLEGFGGNASAYKKYAKLNKVLLDYYRRFGKHVNKSIEKGDLDITEVIRGQLEQLGVKRHNIYPDGNNTFGDTNGDGEHVWHSYKRQCDRQRNLVFVARL